MVRWYHAIFTAYGFWLPNDPRGSWSDFVASWELYRFGGKATKTVARRSVAHVSHDVRLRRSTKTSLNFEPVRFDSSQRGCIASGIEQVCRDSRVLIHACAIGYDHVHAIVARNEKPIDDIVRRFKSWSTKKMNAENLHPMRATPMPDGTLHSPWAEQFWKVFIEDEIRLRTAIDYVERHPQKERLEPQNWPFVVPI